MLVPSGRLSESHLLPFTLPFIRKNLFSHLVAESPCSLSFIWCTWRKLDDGLAPSRGVQRKYLRGHQYEPILLFICIYLFSHLVAGSLCSPSRCMWRMVVGVSTLIGEAKTSSIDTSASVQIVYELTSVVR